MKNDDDRIYPEGHYVGMWIGIGMAIFAGLGIPFSVALDNPGLIGIGPAIGVGFGAAIGSGIEKKKKAEGLVRPLTEAERMNRKKAAIIGSAVLLVGLIVLVSLFFLR
jgi:hypothetical protein